jgi:hypothetical protein
MMIPIRFQDQIQPGSIEYAIDYLVDNEIEFSANCSGAIRWLHSRSCTARYITSEN